MISIQLSSATLILGARPIFDSLNWSIQHNQKIGLIGANGSGKTSLLRLIMGEYQAEPGGNVVRAKGITVGYLPQQVELDPAQAALEAVIAGQPRWEEVRQALEAVENRMADPQVYEHPGRLNRAIEEQAGLLEEWSALGGDSFPVRAAETLTGLGLAEDEHHKPVGQLSGGQKKLVGLARILLSRPEVLLLDEPDNHLDLTGKAYLETLIQEYEGAVVIVSHDRYLLDAVVTHIAEIEDGKLSVFAGDYSLYMADKDFRLARQEELYQVQQREITRLENARKRYAVWLIKNSKFASRMHAIEARLDRMEKIDRPVLDRRRMGLDLGGWQGSRKVLELAGVAKSYDGQVVLDGISAVLQHGSRVGIIGPNGAGKSVLLRIILGQESPDRGEVILGPSVKAGYYAQEHETLPMDMTLLDIVGRAGPMSEPSAVAFLRKFLFTYKQTQQVPADLSGGERSRLQIALLVLSGANFLLLDEPTNNLDIASAEVLENALADFVGTVLVISHDRYFLDRTVERIWALEDGCIRDYPGGYSDYLSVVS